MRAIHGAAYKPRVHLVFEESKDLCACTNVYAVRSRGWALSVRCLWASMQDAKDGIVHKRSRETSVY